MRASDNIVEIDIAKGADDPAQFAKYTLISFGNNTYQYDEYGNRRIKNLTFNYQYTRGNLLLVAGFNSFNYDYLGRRYSKNGADGIIHRYYYDGTKLVGEDRSNGIKLRFFYDKTGLCGFRYIASNSQFADCYYVRNAFNDIVGIANGTTILVRYIYDAWGNHQIIDNSNTNIGAINPFRYKSYYYDDETNLYYLNSRYYDPEIGQFISPDNIEYLEFQELSGINLYSYCGYNPVTRYDPTGDFWVIVAAFVVAIALAATGAFLGTLTTIYTSYYNRGLIKIYDNGDVKIIDSYYLQDPLMIFIFLLLLRNSKEYREKFANKNDVRNIFDMWAEWLLHNVGAFAMKTTMYLCEGIGIKDNEHLQKFNVLFERLKSVDMEQDENWFWKMLHEIL